MNIPMHYRDIERQAREQTDNIPDQVAMEMALRAAAMAGGALPCDVWRHPPGCPDSDYCSGNRQCFWRCQHYDDMGD